MGGQKQIASLPYSKIKGIAFVDADFRLNDDFATTYARPPQSEEHISDYHYLACTFVFLLALWD